MAHYAFLNTKNIVTEIIVGRHETEIVDGISDWETYYSELRKQKCLRTSFNGKIRKNFAGIGFKYDEERDAFIPPKPYTKWVLNEETCQWEAPIARPDDGLYYDWDNQKGIWVLYEIQS